MWFSFVNTTLRADSYIARLYSKCVDKAFREKFQLRFYVTWKMVAVKIKMPIHSGKARQ